MSFVCYILKSLSTDKYYVGHTNNLNRRFVEHNSGQTKSTKSDIPWKIVFTKVFESKSEAAKFEIYIKRMKSRKFIDELITNSL